MTSSIDKILAYLQDNYPEAKDVKSVSSALGINPNTVRGMLPRLVARGDAQRSNVPGWYKATKPRKPALLAHDDA